MGGSGEITDILVLGFLKDGLVARNKSLIEQQQKIAMILLACRHNVMARKKAYHTFIMLEKAISNDYRMPLFRYSQSINKGEAYLAQHEDELKYGRRYPRLSHKVFQYLKERLFKNRQRG